LAIDPSTIIFLLSMMVVNPNLSYAGFFHKALSVLLSFTRSPLGLLVILTFGSGILSAFFLNDTLAIIFTPLTLNLTQALGLNPIPYLLALAAATNTGSVATLSENPQNILIGSFSGINYVDFMKALSPIALTGLLIQVGFNTARLTYVETARLTYVETLHVTSLLLLEPLIYRDDTRSWLLLAASSTLAGN
jgi:Na+/H+ antiporter NhaD/arsenite permease-like protein